MGSFPWTDDYNDVCYTQHFHNRPLSVVLTEPFDPFEPQSSSFFDDIPYIESDFATLNRHHHHHHHHHHNRSRSSGRRYKRESYSVHYPNGNYRSYCFSTPQPICRPLHRVTSREVLVEKIETVTVEEQQPCRPPPPPPPPHYMVSFVRTPSPPPIRQVKIRPRPSSCFDLLQESTELHQQQRENRWSKFVDEHHEEHYQYNYNYNFKTPERIVPIERESPPPPPPRAILHDATTSTADLYIPPPKPVRPETRDTGTTTAGLPRRPLCVTETQIIERFEKTEKVRRDSTSSTDDEFVEKQPQHHRRVSKKVQRKEFMQRMHARNGALVQPCNAVSVYTAAERKRGKSRTIVRPTAYPREVLVDTCGIFGTPGEFSEPTSPQAVENGSQIPSRSPFCPSDLR